MLGAARVMPMVCKEAEIAPGTAAVISSTSDMPLVLRICQKWLSKSLVDGSRAQSPPGRT